MTSASCLSASTSCSSSSSSSSSDTIPQNTPDVPLENTTETADEKKELLPEDCLSNYDVLTIVTRLSLCCGVFLMNILFIVFLVMYWIRK